MIAARGDGRGVRRWLCGGALAIGLAFAATSAAARLTQADLSRIVAAPPPDARIPPTLRFADAADGGERTLAEVVGGRATVLLPIDYTCGNVCDPMLSMTGAALQATGLSAGRDYALVLVGIDPRDDAASARRMLASELGQSESSVKADALIGDAAAVADLTRALGYGFAYDADTDAFAHPAAAILLTGEGRVARVLSPLALNGRDLRLSLIEAGEGRIGGLGDRLALLCYGYDAARGVYTPLIRRILSVLAAVTILSIALGVVLLGRMQRRV